MKVEVENLDRVRKNVEVILDEEKIGEIREGIYAELKKHAKVKGFRPGKVPRSVLQSFYKDYVDEETKRKMVEETMGDALSETHVEPLSEPRIEFLEEKHGYKMECEVEPEFDLPAYVSIEAEVEKGRVTEEDVTKRLESMREMHAQLVAKEGVETVAKGDFVIVRYEGFHNGKPVKDVKSDSYPIDLGDPHVMPEFEAGLMGAKIGEEREIELKFGEDYPDKDIAGKPILMKVEVKEIKEKKRPEVNDEFAKDLGFEEYGCAEGGSKKRAGKGAGVEGKEPCYRADSRLPAQRNRCPRARTAPSKAGGGARRGRTGAHEDRRFGRRGREELQRGPPKRIRARGG